MWATQIKHLTVVEEDQVCREPGTFQSHSLVFAIDKDLTHEAVTQDGASP